MAAWKSVEEPLAACMNGIKGTANTLNKHRGRVDALHPAIDMARIDRPTLEAMLGAMEASFPTFRKYLKAKADVPTEKRLRLLRFIENLTYGRAAVSYRAESLHGAGSPQAQRIMIGRLAGLASKKQLAKRLAGV